MPTITKQIYLDNASTTFPKPQEVAEAVYQYMTGVGSNIGRGGYASAYAAEDLVFEARQLLCDFFHAEDTKNVVFTKNVTEALNIIIRGLFHSGEHILTTAMEHNAVMRPLQLLGAEISVSEPLPIDKLSFTRIPCDSEGNLLLSDLPKLLRPETKAIIMTHASNVCGTVMPIEQVGAFCAEHGLIFIVDSAQSAGVLPIDMQSMHIDALCFTGHKGLLGPQGIGGFILLEHMVDKVAPLIVGGTGSVSHTEKIPRFMPDKFEAGTLNLPGISGLAAGLRWLRKQAIDKLREHELKLTQAFLTGLAPLEAQGLLRIVGRRDLQSRTSVVSITTEAISKPTLGKINKAEACTPSERVPIDIALLAHTLSQAYGIATRVGLHCAPNAHKTLGTYPTGTVRFSFGWSNTLDDVNYALKALEEVLKHGV